MSKEKLIKRISTSHIPPRTSQKGITLIALVVTIIVMLILAGVVINTVLGDDGIISRAEDSKKEQIEKEDMEAIKLAVSGQDILTIAEFEPAGYEKADAIERELATKYGADNVNVREEPTGSDVFIITINDENGNREYTIDSAKQIAKVPSTTTTNPTTTNSTNTAKPTSQATSTTRPTATTATSSPTPRITPTPTSVVELPKLTTPTNITLTNGGMTINWETIEGASYYEIISIRKSAIGTLTVDMANAALATGELNSDGDYVYLGEERA